MIKKSIIIISAKDDAHIGFVAKHLTLPHEVVDPAEIIHHKELSFSLPSETLYNGKSLQALSVWYRKPESFTLDSVPVQEEYKEYSKSALQKHWTLLHGQFNDALWVSDIFAIHRADNKILQLQEAKKLGFNVPDTLFTSYEERAKQFIKKHKNVITKSLSMMPSAFIHEQSYVFMTTKLSIKEKHKIRGLHLAPAVFQQAIVAKLDIRVTVIDDKVFAASITGSAVDEPGSSIRDWKVIHYKGDMVIRPYSLPTDLEDMCRKYVKRFGLKFSAIDIILDNKGKYWFIENNPNGQWAFVEEHTSQPMGKALADLLQSPLQAK